MTPGAPTPNQASPPPPPAPVANAASPPSKRDLKSWWKGFKLQSSKHQESNGTDCPNRITPAASPSQNNPYAGEGALQKFGLLERVLAQHDEHTHAPLIAPSLPVVESSDATETRVRDQSLTHLPPIIASPLRCFVGELSPSLTPLPAPLGRSLTEPVAAGSRPQGIFGVPLRQSITYANVAISLVDENGSSYIYGYVPIVVAKCGVFLKEKATEIEGIFRLNGSEKRIKELKTAFDSPDRYGKGLVWDGYTVHDASNVFRRYLNDLPEPVVPLDLYEKFRDPLRGATKAAGAGDAEGPQFVEGFDEAAAIIKYQQLITELPPLNRQLLLYILDLLAVFAAKSEQNRMNSQNLAAIFQPGMLSHPEHAMAPEEYRLNQCVLIFLIENQDHFLIGMDGTAADEKTKQEVEQGTPTIEAPGSSSTPTNAGSDGLGRTASNASAAAVSVRRDGMIRRNRSTASRHSRHDSTSGTAPSSPAVTTPTGSLARSNTLPSKKSPALPSGRFQKDASPMSAKHSSLSPNTEQPGTRSRGGSPSPSALTPSAAGASNLDPSSAARSQEKLIGSGSEPVSTPVKERNLQSIFQKSPSSESDRRPRNKLKKRTPPGGVNRSAQSSTASLPHSAAVSPKLEPTRPAEPSEGQSTTPAIPEHQTQTSPGDESSEPTPRGSQIPPATLYPENSLKPRKSPPTSLHSSANEGSELGQLDDPPQSASSTDLQERERRKRWRISRGNKKEEGTSPYLPLASPRQPTGSSLQAESSTSIASKPRKSLTNDSSEPASSVMESQVTQESSFGQSEKQEGGGRDETKGPIGWIKNKYREAKETHEQRRNKSPPGDNTVNQPLPGTASMVSFRGKSLDMQREESGQGQTQVSGSQTPQPQQSPPQAVPQVAQTARATERAQEPQQVAPKVTPAPQELQQTHQLPVQEVPQQHAAQTPKISLVAEEPIAEAQQAEIIQIVQEPRTPAEETRRAPESAQTPPPPADPGAGKTV